MVVVDLSKEDFESLRIESSKVNSELQVRAGWKGRLVEFKFDSPQAFYMDVREDSITVNWRGGECARIRFDGARAEFDGSLFEGCQTAQDVARVLRRTCLSDDNVECLRRNTCGCCEVIPFINQTGFADPNDVKVIAFFPKERYDIENALVHSGLSFMVKDISEYPEYCRRNLERLSRTGTEMALVNDFGRTSYLYDGKKFHRPGMARHLSGELQKGMRNICVDAMRRIELSARTSKYALQQYAMETDKPIPPVIFAQAAYPLVGDGSVFIIRDGKPDWGVYLNAEGRITVCDGQGWNDFPKQAARSDHALEALLNSSDREKVSAGIEACCEYINSQCLDLKNVKKAGEDIAQWVNETEESERMNQSAGMRR